MKALVAAFNQEKALVGALSVLTNLRMELLQALLGGDGVGDCVVLLPPPAAGWWWRYWQPDPRRSPTFQAGTPGCAPASPQSGTLREWCHKYLVIVLASLHQECMTKSNLRLERNLDGLINWAAIYSSSQNLYWLCSVPVTWMHPPPTGHDYIDTAMRTLCTPPLLSGL